MISWKINSMKIETLSQQQFQIKFMDIGKAELYTTCIKKHFLSSTIQVL